MPRDLPLERCRTTTLYTTTTCVLLDLFEICVEYTDCVVPPVSILKRLLYLFRTHTMEQEGVDALVLFDVSDSSRPCRNLYRMSRDGLMELCQTNPTCRQGARFLDRVSLVLLDPDTVDYYAQVLHVVPWGTPEFLLPESPQPVLGKRKKQRTKRGRKKRRC